MTDLPITLSAAQAEITRLRAELAARPVAVTVKPLDMPEMRNGYWGHKRGYQVAHTNDGMFRVRLNGKVICRDIRGFARAVSWANAHNEKIILSAITARPEQEVRDDAQWHGEWQWWAGIGEEWMGIGPCPTREDAVSEMVDDGSAEYLDETVDPPVWRNKFYICEAKQDPLRLSDWIGLDWLIDRAEENLADSERVSCEHDDGPWFEATKDQEKDLCERIRRACDDWQVSHGLKFHSSTFSHMRNGEYVTTAAIRAMKGGQ